MINIGDLVVYETKYAPGGRHTGVIVSVQGLKWLKVLWCTNIITSEHVCDIKNITYKEIE